MGTGLLSLKFQVFLGQNGGLDSKGNELSRLVYVSREKRPGFQHHKKAGAMNALENQHLSLLCLGEIGRTNDLSSHACIRNIVISFFESPFEEIQSAASYALGNIAVGNISRANIIGCSLCSKPCHDVQ